MPHGLARRPAVRMIDSAGVYQGRGMSRLTRKNLVLDAEKVRELARRRGTSESAAVREAVENALAVEDVMDAIRALHERGGIEDVFGLLPDEANT